MADDKLFHFVNQPSPITPSRKYNRKTKNFDMEKDKKTPTPIGGRR